MPLTDEQAYIEVNGRRFDFAAAQLIRVTIDQSLLLPDAFDIVLADGLKWLAEGTFDIGREVKVALVQGRNSRRTLITGEVTGFAPLLTAFNAVQLHVRGYDKSHRLQRGCYTRPFVQMTDSDIAERIAQEMGLGCNVTPTTEVQEYVLQYNQTNLEFLRQRAAAIGFQAGVYDSVLYFMPNGEAPDGESVKPFELTWGENLEEIEVLCTTPSQPTEVVVRSWDPKRKEAIVGQSRRSEAGPSLKDTRTGGELVKNIFSMEAPMTVSREDIATQAAADRMAQAIADEMQSGFTTAEGSATGDPRLRPGAEIKIIGVGAFEGEYRVSSARHIFDQLGYRTSFSVEGSRLPTSALSFPDEGSVSPNSSLNGRLVFGLVTNNEDPLDMGRVKVKLPSLAADLESNWCRVLAPTAGNDRGFFFLPEVGDEVLVTFVGDTPVVMGSLWNGQDVPPFLVSQAVGNRAVNLRILESRTGHFLMFDDTDKDEKLVIQDKGGNEIVIESASNKLTITTHGNIELNAGGDIRISADGTLTLKGSTVNIN